MPCTYGRPAAPLGGPPAALPSPLPERETRCEEPALRGGAPVRTPPGGPASGTAAAAAAIAELRSGAETPCALAPGLPHMLPAEQRA